MTITEWLRSRCLAGVVTSPIGKIKATEDEILQIKRTPEFDRLRNNRLLIGAFRYGLSGGFDCIASAIKRLLLYQETGNKEHLVDAANLCELEFIQENNPKAHFESRDDGEHCQRIIKE